MPIPVGTPAAGATSGGLPEAYLRTLIAQRRREVVDPDDGSEQTVWDTVSFTGRIGRGRATEVDEQGRQGALGMQMLFTNYSGLRAEDRIVDPDNDETEPWQLAGDPVVVWDATTVHHYEAPLRRLIG